MDDVQIPQVNATNGPDWHFFGGPPAQNESYYYRRRLVSGASVGRGMPFLNWRCVKVTVTASEQPMAEETPQVTYASYITKALRASVEPRRECRCLC